MRVIVGLDVSLASTTICVLGEKGKIVTEAQVASAPESLVAFMRKLPHGIAAIGLEAGPLSHWLHTRSRWRRPAPPASIASPVACSALSASVIGA